MTDGPCGVIGPENFPDCQLAMPESKAELETRRNLVVQCTQALQKPDNLEGFKSTATAMFEAFGVKAGTQPDVSDWNKSRLQKVYERCQQLSPAIKKGASPLFDIEIRGDNKGYANVNFRFYKIGPVEAVIVSPGPCSLPGLRNEGNPYFPIKNFYEIFEKTTGIDPFTKRENQSGNVFVVVNNRYLVIPSPVKPPRLGQILNKLL